MNVDKFRQDHVTILGGVGELRALAQAGIAENADTIAKKIVSMSSAIKMHLAAEDGMLYPALASSANAEVARIGKAFRHEMGSIAGAYLEFSRQWNYGPRIATDPGAFKNDTNRIFRVLDERIQRENRELYPAAEHA